MVEREVLAGFPVGSIMLVREIVSTGIFTLQALQSLFLRRLTLETEITQTLLMRKIRQHLCAQYLQMRKKNKEQPKYLIQKLLFPCDLAEIFGLPASTFTQVLFDKDGGNNTPKIEGVYFIKIGGALSKVFCALPSALPEIKKMLKSKARLPKFPPCTYQCAMISDIDLSEVTGIGLGPCQGIETTNRQCLENIICCWPIDELAAYFDGINFPVIRKL